MNLSRTRHSDLQAREFAVAGKQMLKLFDITALSITSRIGGSDITRLIVD